MCAWEASLFLSRCSLGLPEALQTRRPRADRAVSVFFCNTDPGEMVQNAWMPEWDPVLEEVWVGEDKWSASLNIL